MKKKNLLIVAFVCLFGTCIAQTTIVREVDIAGTVYIVTTTVAIKGAKPVEPHKTTIRREGADIFLRKILEEMDLPKSDWPDVAFLSKTDLRPLLNSSDVRYDDIYLKLQDLIGGIDNQDFRDWLRSQNATRFWYCGADNLYQYVYYNY